MNEEIEQWLNRQHEWVQVAAHRLLASGNIADDSVDEFVTIIKNPGQPKTTPQTYPKENRAVKACLRLDSLGPVVGIDAISPRTPLGFGDGNLAIVYGANGSGKSGYTRIITKVCGKPHSVELKPSLPSDFLYFRSLFLSAKDDFEGGFLFKLRRLVHADVFANELEQAEYFLSEGYKVPAAVIAGTVLESTIRELCSQNSVVILDKNGNDVTDKAKLDRMNAELAKSAIYNSTRQKQITAWADIRNNAAHGKPTEFNDSQVENMIAGITDFVAQVM